MNSDLTRAFICLELGDEAIKEVARIQNILSGYKFTGKMTELENLHLTLKFIGEIDENKLEKIKEALSKLEFSEFEAKLANTGTFGFRGRPKIVWIKLEGEEIFKLYKKINQSLKEICEVDEKFESHVTIARVRYVKNKQEFVNYVKNINVKSVKFKIGKFYLKKSELKSPGPIYTNICEYSSK